MNLPVPMMSPSANSTMSGQPKARGLSVRATDCCRQAGRFRALYTTRMILPPRKTFSRIEWSPWPTAETSRGSLIYLLDEILKENVYLDHAL